MTGKQRNVKSQPICQNNKKDLNKAMVEGWSGWGLGCVCVGGGGGGGLERGGGGEKGREGGGGERWRGWGGGERGGLGDEW